MPLHGTSRYPFRRDDRSSVIAADGSNSCRPPALQATYRKEATYATSLFLLVAALSALPFTSPAHAQVTVFEEDFDGAALIGWTLEAGWETSASSSSPGSGANNLLHKGNAFATATTPTIDLSGVSSAAMSFLARRTGSYTTANLRVTASADGGVTFDVIVLDTSEAVPASASTYEMISAELPDALIGSSQVRLRFEGLGLNSSSANARIDDVTVTAVVSLELSPSSLRFFAASGSSHELTFAATNHSSGALTLQTPSVSSSVFSVLPTTPVNLPSGTSQTYTVTFAPTADGSYGGTLTLVHDLGTSVVALSGSSLGGTFGFSSTSSETFESNPTFDIPLQLDLSSDIGLQGLQFRIEWTDEVVSLASIERGSPVANTTDWSLSYEPGSTYVDVVLLGSGTTALESGFYDPILSLQVASASISPAESQAVTLQISRVIGALATPEGTDANITILSGTHTLVLSGRRASFNPSPSSLDLGSVDVGDAVTDSIVVTNADGTTDLVVNSVVSSNALFTVTPVSATIQPNASQAFFVAFAPEATSFGRQNGTITFDHNGEGNFTEIAVTGRGHHGRGDAEGDGSVDVLDVVHAIDFVLARLDPRPAQLAAADLFPFPDGDGALDVRDLTLLSQAIARGRWPDDIELPPVADGAGKGGVSLVVSVKLEGDATMLTLTHEMPVRGLQLIIPAERPMTVEIESGGGMVLHSGYDGRRMRVLMYRQDGAAAPAGILRLAVNGRLGVPTYASVIGADRKRISVVVEMREIDDEVPVEDEIGAPYPNPFKAGAAVLKIPRADEVRVYNVLGQLIWRIDAPADVPIWDGRNSGGIMVSPGLYLLEVKVDGQRASWPIVVSR